MNILIRDQAYKRPFVHVTPCGYLVGYDGKLKATQTKEALKQLRLGIQGGSYTSDDLLGVLINCRG